MKKLICVFLFWYTAVFTLAANVYVDSEYSGSEGDGSSWSSPIKTGSALNTKLAGLTFTTDNYIYIKRLVDGDIVLTSGPQGNGKGLYFIGCDSNGDKITTIGEYATWDSKWSMCLELHGSFHSVFVENIHFIDQSQGNGCLTLDVSCKGFHVRNCKLVAAYSVSIYTDSTETLGSLSVEDCVFASYHGIYLDPHATKNRTLFVKNSTFKCTGRGILFGKGTLISQFNVFDSCSSGIHYMADTHLVVEHSTFYGCSYALYGNSSDQKAVVLNYNIFAGCNADLFILNNAITPRYNITTRNTTAFADSTNQINVSLSDIAFTDAANGDFSLQKTSIALDVDASTQRGGRTAGAWQPASNDTTPSEGTSRGAKGALYKNLF